MKRQKVIRLFLFPIFILIGGYVTLREAAIRNDRVELKKALDDRMRLQELIDVWKKWFSVEKSGRRITDFFTDNGYANVAIYGMSDLGVNLYNELTKHKINVKYGIDRNKEVCVDGLKIINPDDLFEEVDVIIVTPIHFFGEIADLLNKKVNCPVVSIENVINYE